MTRRSSHLRLLVPRAEPDDARLDPVKGDQWRVDMHAVTVHRDRAAFMRIYDHFWPRVVSYLLRLGLHDGQAQELSQEAFLKLWQRPELYDPTRGMLSTWMFRMARNLWIDSTRREPGWTEVKNAFEVLEHLSADTGEEVRQLHEVEEHLKAALAALPPDQAEVIRLSYFEARTQRDIASFLGLPLGTVKSKTRLAFNKLRQALANNP